MNGKHYDGRSASAEERNNYVLAMHRAKHQFDTQRAIPGAKPNVKAIAKAHFVKYESLNKVVTGKRRLPTGSNGRSAVLNEEQEVALAAAIAVFGQQGEWTDISELPDIVAALALSLYGTQFTPSASWSRGFVARHPEVRETRIKDHNKGKLKALTPEAVRSMHKTFQRVVQE